MAKPKKVAIEDSFTQKRAYQRYLPALGTVALISFKVSESFTPSHSALVLDEAYKGVHLVMTVADTLIVGSRFKIQVGSEPPAIAEVRWKTILDDRVMRVGVMFVE